MKIPLSVAIRTARKKLKFMPYNEQNESLRYYCGSLADAYRIGADEAQSEIIRRLSLLSEGDPSQKIKSDDGLRLPKLRRT